MPTPLGRVVAHVAAITLVLFGRVSRRHRAIARLAVKQTFEDCPETVSNQRATMAAVALEQTLHAIPNIATDDWLVLPLVNLGFVLELAEVSDVSQHPVQHVFVVRASALSCAFLGRPLFGSPAARVEFLNHADQAFVLHVEVEDRSNLLGLGLIQNELGIDHIVTKWREASAPFAFTPRGSDLIARPLGDGLAFELREGQ